MKKLDQTFKINPLYEADSYKIGHKAMLASGTTREYGTWIPRSLKYMHPSITEVMSAGQQLVVRYLHSTFAENFFYTNEIESEIERLGGLQGVSPSTEKTIKNIYKEEALKFVKDMSAHLGTEYDGKHFEDLWDLGYLPIKIKALPEGIFTPPNVPHMTFINTVDGYAWLTLFLETYISKLAWQLPTAATVAHKFRQNANEWVAKTDPANMWLTDFMCHDFHSRGGNPFTSIAVGLGHAISNKGSDTLNVIPASRYYYDEAEDSMPVFSVVASEHSVSTTKIFTVGEQQMIADCIKLFPNGILSIVSDTFDLWKLITEYLPANKEAIMARNGKLVIRPDSGDPVDIICGKGTNNSNTIYGHNTWEKYKNQYNDQTDWNEQKEYCEYKGVIELLWDIFGGTINEQGFKVLDPHIGAIYGDSINLERQVESYKRLEAKGFAATNVVFGVGSYTYVYQTRDGCGWAAKGSWFEVEENFLATPESVEWGIRTKTYNIFKDPVTDDGQKRSLRGLLCVDYNMAGEIEIHQECPLTSDHPAEASEDKGLLQVIYEDGEFYNQTTLTKIRERVLNHK
jgi:nicotinamide phosphoribosyltransferase